MKKYNSKFLENILFSRKLIIQMVITSILASVGTNLITEDIAIDNFKKKIIGILIIAVVITIFYKQSFEGVLKRTRYKGFFVYNKYKQELVEVERYDFSSNMIEFINAATSESDDFKIMFEKAREKWPEIYTKECRFIRELLEYYFLDKLKVHTIDYFNTGRFELDRTKEVSISDIPLITAENNFLKLFSKPLDERAAFNQEEYIEFDNLKYRIIASFSKDGAMFDEFKLILPAESEISRSKDGGIEIITDKFTANFNFSLIKNGGILPAGFREYYLSERNFFDMDINEVFIDVSVKFSTKLMFFNRSLEYYDWIDSFLEHLDRDFSSEKFFEKIGWNTAFTTIKILDNQKDI